MCDAVRPGVYSMCDRTNPSQSVRLTQVTRGDR